MMTEPKDYGVEASASTVDTPQRERFILCTAAVENMPECKYWRKYDGGAMLCVWYRSATARCALGRSA